MPDDTAIDFRQTVAALRRQLDARTAERDEALAREAAMAEVIQVINASPGDLVPVFDATLERHCACVRAFRVLCGLSMATSRGLPLREGSPRNLSRFCATNGSVVRRANITRWRD